MLDSLRHHIHWGYFHARDGVERALAPSDFSVVNDRVYTPTWTSGPFCAEYLRDERRDKGEYFTMRSGRDHRPEYVVGLRPEEDDRSLKLRPPEPFFDLDLDIIDVREVDEVTVTAEFTCLGGDEHQISKSLRNGTAYFSNANRLPVSFTLDTPAEAVNVRLLCRQEKDKTPRFQTVTERLDRYEWKPDQTPWLSMPIPRGVGGVPIFLISVDTFRYDALDAFGPALDALGDDVTIPAEPRTQGHWTRPSHASMFTGVHPGTHGYVGGAGQEEGNYGIHPDLTTIPEYLTERQYKCSGCVVREKTGPEYGFGRGMHRYKYHPMSWGDRDDDAANIVDTVIEWVEADRRGRSNRLFYFLHIFDAHFPYVPPTTHLSDNIVDFGLVNAYREALYTDDYLRILREDPFSMSSEDLERLRTYYYNSVEYVANQLARLFSHLDRVGLLQESLVIVTGDHGEDFLERQFGMHNSLTDINIRPAMAVKPPASADLTIPDAADTIDFFPTITKLVDGEIPGQCAGQPWQSHESRPRITERIFYDWYNLSIEINDRKAIFTYPEAYPNRPGPDQLNDGPVEVEFFDLSVRDNETLPVPFEPTKEQAEHFEEVAIDFLGRENLVDGAFMGRVDVSPDVAHQLEQLGYK